MLIILDGCDNTGKSHIAKALSIKLKYPLLKYSIVDRANLNTKELSHVALESSEYSLRILTCLGNPNIIIDRHYPSEYVYSSVFRHPNFAKLTRIDNCLVDLLPEHLIVVCHKRKLKEKKSDFIDFKKYSLLQSKYFEFVKNFSRANILLLDTTDENLDKQIVTIIDTLNRCRRKK
jgi:thymidylate kinase